jgi:mRNA interferase HigB
MISEKALRDFWQKHADAKEPLRSWLKATKRAKWQNMAEVRQTFNSADVTGIYTSSTLKAMHTG